MGQFRLTLRMQSLIPIDLTGVLPETMGSRSVLDVEKMKIGCGCRRVPLGEFFSVRAESNSAVDGLEGFVLEGDCSNVHSIGVGMSRGRIRVLGSAGRHAGARMSGGQLDITGVAGDWLGAEMRGGSIVADAAGSQAGAAYRGSRQGMTGGTIMIQRNAGDEVGVLMRRGLIGIRGHCGSFAGAAMIAGTIIVDGVLGPNAGAGMKRGTIITQSPVQLSCGFRYSCDYSPQYRTLLDKHFQKNAKPGITRTVRLYRGDLLTGGRGEIWEVLPA